MHPGDHWLNRRTIGVLVLLCVTVLGQWCALEAEHQQHSSDEHCCLLCHIGPHATLDAVAPIFQAPDIATAWIASPADHASPPPAPVSRSSSRAPPAGFCS